MYVNPEPYPLEVIIKSSNQEGRQIDGVRKQEQAARLRLSISRSKIYFLRLVEECPSSLQINLMTILCPTNWVTLARFSTVLTITFQRIVRPMWDQALLLWSSTIRSAKEEAQLFVYQNLWDCDKLFLYLLFVYRNCPLKSSLLHPSFYRP